MPAKKPVGRPRKKLPDPLEEKPNPNAIPVPRAHRVGERSDNDGTPTNLFDGAGREQRVRLYREDDVSKRMIFHGALAVEEATEDKVAELFGGGKFRAQLMVRNETGLEVVQRTQDFRLPGAYIVPTGKLPGIGPAPTAAATPTGAPTLDFRAGGTMSPNEALNQVLINQVLDVVRAGRETRTTYEPLLQFATVILPPLIEGIFSRKADAGSEVRAALDEMRRELASLRNQPGPVTAGIGDAVKAIRELVEVRDVITGGGNGDGEGGEKGMMWKIAGEALKVLAGQQPNPAAEAPPSRIPGRTEVPMQPQGPPRPMWEQMLLHYRPQLLETIRRGVAPEFAADIALQFMEPTVQGVVVEFVKRPDHVQLAAQVIPELVEFPVWSEAFWRTIREAMAEEPERSTEGEQESEDQDQPGG